MSEAAIIGALLHDSSLWDEAARFVTAGDFTDRRWRKAWVDICELTEAGEDWDMWTLTNRGHDLGLLGDVQANTTPLGIARYARAVRDASQRRQAVGALAETRQRLLASSEDTAAVLADHAAQLEAISDGAEDGYHDAHSAMRAAYDAQNDALAARANNGIAGIPTGLHLVNQVSAGLRKRELTILAARPSVGKTSLSMAMAYSAADKGFSVGVVELEMDAAQLVNRQLSAVSGVLYWDLTRAEPNAIRRAREHAAALNLPVYIDDRTTRLEGILARAAEWKRKHDMSLLLVDHVGLVQTGKSENRAIELGNITFALKNLAKRLDIAVLALCQLNRKMEGENREPNMADLRESGRIEENADTCMFLHCPADEREKLVREVSLGALKVRNGVPGWRGQPLKFDAAFQRWSE